MKIISKNKIAYHDYSFDKEYEVGIVLKWFEVKSIKSWQVNLRDSIVRIENNELWINNMDVPLYNKTSANLVWWYQPKGKRKLLINHRELVRMTFLMDKSWNTIVPLEIFINKKWLIKLKIWIWKLMRKVEKKQKIKDKDNKRQMDRELKWIRK